MKFGSNLIIFLIYIFCSYPYKVNSKKYKQYNGKIIGGNIVFEMYSYMVSVQLQDRKHYCGGSLIAPRWILSAAHCIVIHYDDGTVYRLRAREIRGVAGTINVAKPARTVQIRQCHAVFAHPDYIFKTIQNDIAMISVKEAFTLQYITLAPTNMIEDTFKTRKRSKCKVLGWGYTDEDRKQTSNVLQEVELSLLSGAECKPRYPNNKISPEKQICTLESGKDACMGDSGGPLICNDHLFGIVSWGVGCARQYPGVYTRPDYYIDWIRSTIENNSIRLAPKAHLILITITPLCFGNLFL